MKDCIVVTGASSGIGLACAKRLTAEGHDIVNLDIREPEGDATRFPFVKADVRNRDSVDAAFATAAEGRVIAGLVNNAGISIAASLEGTTEDDIRRGISVNLEGAIRCTQAALRSMKSLGRGRIVNIASRTALGRRQRSVYGATKGALISLTRTWALELAPYRITVNAVGPGPVATELFRKGNAAGAPETRQLIASIPLGRIGEPEDVANAVAFFMDARSGFVTGQTLYVCGGLSVGTNPV
jgi:NAD(P)-dependent dehydrogenase (short-subunit alcohol dehydrogenase family)